MPFFLTILLDFLGVGGMVINDKNQVLTIQERFHEKPHWKLPGGYSNPGNKTNINANIIIKKIIYCFCVE